MLPSILSQRDYISYTRYLNDVKTIEKFFRKQRLSRLCLLQDRFVKAENRPPEGNIRSLFEKLSTDELRTIPDRIKFINRIHQKLEYGKLNERNVDDCAPLAAEFFNTYLKTIVAWNKIFTDSEMHIVFPHSQAQTLNPSFSEKSTAQIADEKALARYFELLTLYPKLKREGELNDYTKGAYEIVYDPQAISEIRKEIYERLSCKAQSQGLNAIEAEEWALSSSRPGVVCEDQFWLWIRDIVISPQNFKHTYNRIVWKGDLEKVGGAAALPILIKNGEKKVITQLAFRHATQSWEIEMSRGGSKSNETPVETAKREIFEETGCVVEHLEFLGSITPDSGLTASVVPIYLGQVTKEQDTHHDKTEAIKGKYAFTFQELIEGLKKGYMEVLINDKLNQVPIRDPFLAYALLMAQHKQLL